MHVTYAYRERLSARRAHLLRLMEALPADLDADAPADTELEALELARRTRTRAQLRRTERELHRIEAILG